MTRHGYTVSPTGVVCFDRPIEAMELRFVGEELVALVVLTCEGVVAVPMNLATKVAPQARPLTTEDIARIAAHLKKFAVKEDDDAAD